MPCPDADHLTSILNELYEDRGKLKATAELCHLRATDSQFHWKNIASQFGGVFQDTLNGISHSVVEDELKDVKRKRKNKKRTLGAVK
jgi:predicted N-acyltransferase